MEVFYQDGQHGGVFQHDNTQPPTETQVFPLLSLKGKTAIVTGGGDDIFVANAGISWYTGNIIDSDTDKFKNIIDVNVLSVYYAAKAAGKHFRRQKLEGTNLSGKKITGYKHGSFVITSSMAATKQLMPQYLTPYAISKAALNQFTRSLSGEWIKFCRVNSVSAGYILTPLTAPAPDLMLNAWKGRVPMG
ncbi:hypothetical protein AA313_de0201352 [Arthrobotrys entomopaga]|nr:hypothetical protein AA313_de0201352 [Arthrobotrys entomopaga]